MVSAFGLIRAQVSGYSLPSMRPWVLWSAAILPCCVLALCVVDLCSAQGHRNVEPDFVPGTVWVQFVSGKAPTSGAGKIGSGVFDQVDDLYGAYAIQEAFPFLEASDLQSESVEGLKRVYSVRFDVRHSPQEVAAALMRDPSVEYAEPKVVSRTFGSHRMSTPNDPLYADMAPYFERAQFPEAWDMVKGEQGDVVIAIVDSGVNWRHEDLRNNVWVNLGEVAGNGLDDDGNGWVDDVHGYDLALDKPYQPGDATSIDHASHGTTVAGMAVAVADNGTGITGTSWNAKFMSIGAACEDLSDNSICRDLTAVAYAARMGADIITASYGSYYYSHFAAMVYQAALDMGSLVVAAAGNEAVNSDVYPSYPANFPSVLSVGATRLDVDINRLNYGRTVDVYAAGLDLTGLQLRTGYEEGVWGTSFSAPLVAGLAAMVKTAFPGFTPHQVREQVRYTADRMENLHIPELYGLLGRGRANAYRAVSQHDIVAVRPSALTFGSSDAGPPGPGWESELTVTASNYFADVGNVEIVISEAPSWFQFSSTRSTLASLGGGTSAQVRFPFLVTDAAPYKGTSTIVVGVLAHGQTELSSVRLEISQAEVANFRSDNLSFSVTSEGNLGFIDRNLFHPWNVDENDSLGTGIRFGATYTHALEAGLIVATGPDRMSRSVSSIWAYEGIQPTHFQPKQGQTLAVDNPGSVAAFESRITLEDSGAPDPIGVEIRQESYFDDGPGIDTFAILRYTVTNATASPVENLHVGLLIGWRLSANTRNDIPAYDTDRRLGYQYVQTKAPPVLGVRVLSHEAGHHFAAYDFGTYPSSGEALLWDFLSSGVQRPRAIPDLWGQVYATGPYSLAPGEQGEAAFAIVGGNTIEEFLSNADRAQSFWEDNFESTSIVQFVQDVSREPVDVYLDGVRVMEGWSSTVATGYVPVARGRSTLEVVSAGADMRDSPLLATELGLEQLGAYHAIITEIGGGQLGVVLARGARNRALSSSVASVRIANSVVGEPTIHMRVLDASNASEVAAVSVDHGSISRYVDLEPGSYVWEVMDLDAGTVMSRSRVDLRQATGKSFLWHVSGVAASGVSIAGFKASGDQVYMDRYVLHHEGEGLPAQFVLHGNYPNPFNPTTSIYFDLPQASLITVELVDMAGRRLWTGPAVEMEAGYGKSISINSQGLPSGTYLYRLHAVAGQAIHMEAGKMVVIK